MNNLRVEYTNIESKKNDKYSNLLKINLHT